MEFQRKGDDVGRMVCRGPLAPEATMALMFGREPRREEDITALQSAPSIPTTSMPPGALVGTLVSGTCGPSFSPDNAAPMNKLSFLRVARYDDKCTKCKACVPVCPMKINTLEMERDMECIRCGRCVSACKFDAMRLTFLGKPILKE